MRSRTDCVWIAHYYTTETSLKHSGCRLRAESAPAVVKALLKPTDRRRQSASGFEGVKFEPKQPCMVGIKKHCVLTNPGVEVVIGVNIRWFVKSKKSKSEYGHTAQNATE